MQRISRATQIIIRSDPPGSGRSTLRNDNVFPSLTATVMGTPPIQHAARSENPSEVAILHGYVSSANRFFPPRRSSMLIPATFVCTQGESQNPDHRWVRLWSLRSTRLDDRFHHLFCEAEAADTTCKRSGVQEPQGHHRFRARAQCHDLHHPT